MLLLCEDLKVAEIKTAGVPNHKVKTLIVDINFDKRYFEDQSTMKYFI